VVCSGAKAILDLPKTLEALETLAVPVIGVGTDELPAFYCAQSGLRLLHRVDAVAQAAQLAGARLSQATGAIIFARPLEGPLALVQSEVEEPIARALEEASRRGIRGKAVTPFLLSAVSAATGGRALQANLALLEQNAGFAGSLAVELSRLSRP